MLIQFSVKNFRSVCEKQTFSMSASNLSADAGDERTFDTGIIENTPRLVRAAAIYGPNAAGKSTIVKAMSFVKDMVINSAKTRQEDEKLDVEPFRLSSASRSSDSEFEVTFLEDGIRYQLGFVTNKRRVTEEWLYAYPNGHLQKWYQRIFDEKQNKDVYKFSKFLEGGRRRSDWREQTRSNALFLSTAIQLNSDQLKPAFSWFNKRLRIVSPNYLRNNYTTEKCKEPANKSKILEFLNAADLSIADIKVETRKFVPDELPADMPPSIREMIIKDMSGKDISDVRFLHRDVDSSELIPFNNSDESEGTQHLYAFAGPWLDLIENDRVMIVDEIDTSLHPLVVDHLVKLLHRVEGKAQLVFTTHDTTLLGRRLLRADQVWFVEKNTKQETQLYSLSDFSPRALEAIEKGYLSGRYGAVPLLRELKLDGN